MGKQETSIDRAESQLIRASLICLVFMIAEIIGGYLAGSLAILTDAAHLLSDLVGFSVSLVCLWLARRKATAVLSFGFKRAEVLGALLSVSLIWVVTGFLIVEAFERTSMILSHDPSYEPVNGELMFGVAILGLICNLIILRVLGHSHSHGGGMHGHSHGVSEEDLGNDDGHVHNHSSASHSHSRHGHSHESKHEHGHSDEESHGHSHNNNNESKHDHGHSDEESHGHSHNSNNESEEDENKTGRTSSPPMLAEEHEMNGLSIRYSFVGSDYGAIESPRMEGSKDDHAEDNLNIQAAYIHALGDFLQSIGVIIAGGLIWWFPAKTHPKMQLADPIATFFFSLLVLYSTWQVLKTSVNVLMEGVPAGLDPNKIKRNIERVPGVLNSHDLHIWSLSIGHPFLSVHVVLEKDADGNTVLRRVHEMLYAKYRISHATVQIELESHYSDGRVKKYTECHDYDGDDV